MAHAGLAFWVTYLFVLWVNWLIGDEKPHPPCPSPEPPRKVTTKEGYRGTLYQYTDDYGLYDGQATTIELEIPYG
jgi:hypothetical protein